MNKQAVLSLSGGLDSSTLLLNLLSEGHECTCISFNYGQKHSVELERAKELVEYINANSYHEDEQYYPKVKHQVIELNGLSQLLDSTLVTGGAEVPEGHYSEANQRQTVVPNRNKIFSSIIQAIALSISNSKNTECIIAMGIHAGDSTIYPDCKQEFRDIDYQAFLTGNWDAERVTYYTPYINIMKFDILKDGEKSCERLGLDFNEVYKRTNTSYKPIKLKVYYNMDNGVVEEQEEWFSDYKSASSTERLEAFIKLGRKDPVSYADSYGPVTWEYVVEYVTQVLEDHNK
jgi:7-cyano-7-deazaguanine synthase